MRAESFHRLVRHAGRVGQCELDPFVECRLQGFFSLRATISKDDGFEVGLQRRFTDQRLVITPPDQCPGLTVVFQQVVVDGQVQALQHRYRGAAQQGRKPAVKGANLHRPAGGQHGRIQALKLHGQTRRRGLVVQAWHTANLQFVQQLGAVCMGKFGEPFVEPLAHFASGTLGEGDGQNFLRLQAAIGTGFLDAFEQGAHHARDQHPGLAGTRASLDRHAAARVAGNGVKGIGRDQFAVAFVSGWLRHAATRKSRRHRPRASQ